MTGVFDALSDPTRRALLERLRVSGPQSIGALTAGQPISRQAITKHLDTLGQAGLVRIERRGRERLHRLEPLPLRDVDDWLAPYTAAWDHNLARLRHHLEDER